MMLQSWQLLAIIVIAFVFGLGIGRTFGESRAWAKMDRQAHANQSMAWRFARRLMVESRPYPVLDIPYEDEPIHTDAHPFCEDETCPCHFGHVVDGRILVEQESM